jgi:hypothetical protein
MDCLVNISISVCHRRFFIKRHRFSFRNRNRIHRALTQARPQPIAISLAHELRFAVNNLNRAFNTGIGALAAAVALLFIDIYDFSCRLNCHIAPLFYPFNSFHFASPRHSRALAHQSIQVGVFSRYTISPHF